MSNIKRTGFSKEEDFKRIRLQNGRLRVKYDSSNGKGDVVIRS